MLKKLTKVEEKVKRNLIVIAVLFLITTAAYSFTNEERVRGYALNGETIVFVFDKGVNKDVVDASLKKGAKITAVSLLGSFNGWKNPEKWRMSKEADSEVWTLTKKIKEINIPGNSGYPEFKFYAEGEYERNGSINPTEAWFAAPEFLQGGYKFSDQFEGKNNYLVIQNGDNTEAIIRDNLQAVTIKKEFASDEEISNFREVKTGKIAAGKLYRSYNPYIKSKKIESEVKRLQKVQELMEKNGVKTVINLSDNISEVKGNRVPQYYKTIVENNNILLAETSYNDCYYYSDGDRFAKTIGDVVKFVEEKEPPYLIHCRLGTDRTGVTTAFLEGLMGASWREIADDYLRSNNVGMGEFRSEKLLKYSYEKMLGIEIRDNTIIASEIEKYLKTRVGLKDEEITKIKSKLN